MNWPEGEERSEGKGGRRRHEARAAKGAGGKGGRVRKKCAKKYGETNVAISGNWSTPRAFVGTVNHLLSQISPTHD